jgi:NADH-quinone oxidoreductase subunit H
MSPLLLALAVTLVKIAVVLGAVMTAVAMMALIERRFAGLIQDRPGPNRVGPFGLLQPVADGLKFLFKEEVIPDEADKWIYLLAPLLAFVPAMAFFAVIPMGTPFTVFGIVVEPLIAPSSFGVLYILALSGLSVYGVFLAGYASGSKYPLLGGLRATAQIVAYEIPMAMALLAVVYAARSLDFTVIADAQAGTWFGVVPKWFVLPQIIGFFVFWVAILAECKRLPFDLPEAEAELVVGFHTEYSAMKFAMFFMGEYAHMIAASAIVTLLYFGGWHLPFAVPGGNLGALIAFAAFAAKTAFFLWLFIWIRWTLPRYRYDQLIRLGWTVLTPLAFLNLLITLFTCRAPGVN